MAIVAIRKLFAGRSGTLTKDERTYEAAWQVETDNASDDQVVVLNAMAAYLGTPWMNLGNGQDTASLCKSLTASLMADSRLFWLVTGTWEVPTQDDKGNQTPNGETSDNPEDWRDQVDIGAAKFTEPVERARILTDLPAIGRPKDSEGPVVNAAGEVYDPAPERDQSRKIYRITKFRNDFNSALYDDFDDKVNRDGISLNKPGLRVRFKRWTLKMEPITGALAYHIRQDGSTIPYWKINFEMAHNPDTWVTEIVNMGNYRRALAGDPDGKGGTRSHGPPTGRPPVGRVVDDDDNPMGPVLLDLNGQPLGPGDQAVYLSYLFYKEADFDRLRI